MADETENGNAPEEMGNQYPTGVQRCLATGCRYNNGMMCNFKQVEIGPRGRCVHYQRRTAKQVRAYLAATGLTPAQIELLMRQMMGGA